MAKAMSPSVMEHQRNQALACMILAICIAGATFLSVFGTGDSVAIARAREAAVVHEGLLRDTTEALRQNQQARDAVRLVYEALERSRKR
jgi:hypothetical protein